MSGPKFDSVWDALSDSPEQAENMKARSRLMMDLSEFVKTELFERQELTGKQAAEVLGLTQPRVSYLVNGKIEQFSLDKLVEIAARAGFHVSIGLKKNEDATAA
jgi:predicted XRE-type DNA-binding protein